MSEGPSHKLTGAFVLGAIALAVAGLIVFGSGKLFQVRVPAIMYFTESVNGLDVGAPVNFNGVQVGIVRDIDLVWNLSDNTFRTPVTIDFLPDTLQYEGAPASIITAIKGGRDVGQADELIIRGLRAQLSVTSLLTGRLQISLVMRPDTQAVLVSPTEPSDAVYEIPTIPSDIARVKATVRNLMGNLSKQPLDDILKNFNATLDAARILLEDPNLRETFEELREAVADVRTLVKTVETEVGPLSASLLRTSDSTGDAAVEAKELFAQARTTVSKVDPVLASLEQAMARAQLVLENMDSIVDPDAPLQQDLTSALRQVRSAARAIRSLADTLERNPDSILFGR